MNKILEAYQNKSKPIVEFKRGNIKYDVKALTKTIARLEKYKTVDFYTDYPGGKNGSEDDDIYPPLSFKIDTKRFITDKEGYIIFDGTVMHKNIDGIKDETYINLILNEGGHDVEIEKA